MKEIILLYLLLYTVKFSISNLPEWNLENSAISLLVGTENKYQYLVKEKNEHDMNTKLFKYIAIKDGVTKNDNWVEVPYKENNGVNFENLGSVHYINPKNIICPRGKFHPYYYNNNNLVEWKPGGFYDNGDWDLKCYQHDIGNLFIVVYLMKSSQNTQYIYTCKYTEINGGLYDKGFEWEKLYDFHLGDI